MNRLFIFNIDRVISFLRLGSKPFLPDFNDSRAQHGLSPSGNLINMHKIRKIASVGFNSQLLANT